jgi:hypothetical protein
MNAAINGHLHILQWATANGRPCDVLDCADLAPRNGHDAVFEWIDAANIGETDDDEQNDEDATNDNSS